MTCKLTKPDQGDPTNMNEETQQQTEATQLEPDVVAERAARHMGAMGELQALRERIGDDVVFVGSLVEGLARMTADVGQRNRVVRLYHHAFRMLQVQRNGSEAPQEPRIVVPGRG